MIENILAKLDEMIGDVKCELEYHHDYELLIAVVLSAQCSDAKVNKVTKVLFDKYDLKALACANISDIQNIIYPCGMHKKKAHYIIQIAKHLVEECNSLVVNNAVYLESLPGVGHKSANVVLAQIFNEPTMAVDTHVMRVSKRLNLVKEEDNVLVIEGKLCKLIPKNKWSRTHLQLVLFGRYICKAKKPECAKCLLNQECIYKNKL